VSLSTNASSRVRAVAIGALLAAALLVAGRQITLHGWYAASGAYRAQVDALLAGRTALSDAPEAIQHDLAWTEHGVQQVWGLGVPLWQLPFEVVGRVVGLRPFPDRIALAAWLALAFAALIRAWWRRDEPWLGAGCVLIAGLLPPVVTLVRGRLGVYEEAALYSYAAAMILLSGAARVMEGRCRVRYWIVLAAAGASGFIRPTVWFYGLATAIVLSVAWLAAHGRRGIATVAIGAALFAAGGAALYASNAQRFGAGLEFGHRLNLEGLPGNLYATRFSHPAERTSFASAAAEELGALFDRPDKHVRTTFYGRNLHVGQAPIVGWREYYFTTFTWGYVPLLLAGVVLGVLAWRRRDRAGPERWLVSWAALAGVPLFIFYLHAPSMSSRYQLDLAPAFVALLLVAWRAFARRARVRIAIGVLAAAWLTSIVLARTAEPRSADPVGRAEAERAMLAITAVTSYEGRKLPAAYDLTDPWVAADMDMLESFDRCTDETGDPVDPDSAPLGGEHCLHGERAPDDEQWSLAVTEVPPPPPETCTLPEPRCELSATVANAGEPLGVIIPAPALYLNLFRWDIATGEVPSATFAWVQDPAYIQLDVSAQGGDADWARDVRVAIGRTHLHLASATSIAGGVRLRFEGGPLPRGLAVAFLAFGPDDELANVHTRFALHRIQWRDR
jgi:hypothetical protein